MSEFSGNYRSRDNNAVNPINKAAISLRLKAEEKYKDGTLKEFKDAMERLHLLAFPRFRRRKDIEAPKFIQVNPEDDDDQKLKTDLDNYTADELRELLNKYAILFEELDMHGGMKKEFEEDEMGRKKKR